MHWNKCRDRNNSLAIYMRTYTHMTYTSEKHRVLFPSILFMNRYKTWLIALYKMWCFHEIYCSWEKMRLCSIFFSAKCEYLEKKSLHVILFHLCMYLLFISKAAYVPYERGGCHGICTLKNWIADLKEA